MRNCQPSMVWVPYDWNVPPSRPTEYGKYLILRKDGKVHWETWNGSGWADNNRVIVAWSRIVLPEEFREEVLLCPHCGSSEVETVQWVNINTQLLSSDPDVLDDEGFCNECSTKFHKNFLIVKTRENGDTIYRTMSGELSRNPRGND